MVTVQWNRGNSTGPFTAAAGLTTRQAATYMANSYHPDVWWHADWRLLVATGDGELFVQGQPPPVKMTAPDVLFDTLDGETVVLGWLEMAEIWN